MENFKLSELNQSEMQEINGGGLLAVCIITGILLLLAQEAR